jgi:hypothetical protein
MKPGDWVPGQGGAVIRMWHDHLRRANDELDGREHRPTREEIEPPTDKEVRQAEEYLRRRAAERQQEG